MCVARTARRRRKQMTQDLRYRKRDPMALDRKHAARLQKLREMQARSANKKSK